MRKVLLIIVSMLVTMPAFASEQSDLLQAMAEFDRNYIPALSLTNQGQQAQSVNAIRRLRTDWAEFKIRYQDGYGSDNQQWQQDMNAIEEQMTQAQNQINVNELSEAHESLEKIRFIFMEMRQRNGIEYFMDYLTRFHEPMEEIVMLAAQAENRNPESVKLDILKRMEPLLSSWNDVRNTELPLELFDVPEEKQTLIRKFIEDESEALSQLESALQHKTMPDIIKAAKGIKPPFVRLYLSFGNFGGV